MNILRFRKFMLPLVILITAVIISSFTLSVSAASAKTSISFSSGSAYINKQVTVTVSFTADKDIGGWDFNLTYDPSLVKYVSGADVHTNGTCRVMNVNMDGSKKKTISFNFVFNTLKQGQAKFSVSISDFIGEDYSKISVTPGSSTLSIIPEPVYVPSGINTLSSLAVEGFEISPAFSAGTNDYTLTVDYPVRSVKISAATSHNLAKYDISGPEQLSVGENTYSINVKAENGSLNTYKITVTRNESPYSAQKVTIDGNNYIFPVDETEISVPGGFEINKTEYGGKDVLAFTNAPKTLTIVALEPEKTAPSDPEAPVEDGTTKEFKWFIYDKDSSSFIPFVKYSPGTMSYVVLPAPEDLVLPDGYYEEHKSIGNTDIITYKNDLFDDRFSLIYAAPVNGTPGLYVYDSLDNTIQYYMTYEGQPTEKTVNGLNDVIDSLNDEKKGILNEKQQVEEEKDRFGKVIIACIAIIVLLLILLIFVICRKKKSGSGYGDDKHRHHHDEESGDSPSRKTVHEAEDRNTSELDLTVFSENNVTENESSVKSVDKVPDTVDVQTVPVSDDTPSDEADAEPMDEIVEPRRPAPARRPGGMWKKPVRAILPEDRDKRGRR